MTSPYRRTIRIVSETNRPRAVTLEDDYVIFDPLIPNKKTWQYIYRAEVDPATGHHTAPDHAREQFLFPRRVQKQTYTLRSSYLKGVPVSFQREEEVAGLTTYLFSYQGPAEYSEAYMGTAEFEGMKLEPGQEVRCTDDQFAYKVWVEPLTGEVVKVEESCLSGDAVYDGATGKLLFWVARWGGSTVGDDVLLRAAVTQRARAEYLSMAYYVPGVLLMMGLVLLGLATRVPKSQARGGRPAGEHHENVAV